MAKFKVGDRIRLKDYSAYGDHREHKGEIGIVEEVDFDSIRIKWNDGVISVAWFKERSKPYKIAKPSSKTISQSSLRLY